MRRALLCAVACLGGTLVLAAGAAPALDPDLKPPTLIAPAQSQAIVVGTQVTFRIKTHPGDRTGLLWLQVSRSGRVAKSCGTIGEDADIEPFKPTGTAGVYQSKPRLWDEADFWMNRLGTYYWQAYRIGGKDGCVESQVRKLRIVQRPPLPLDQARLEGRFNLVERITAVDGFSMKVGDTEKIDFTFEPGQLRFGVSEFGIVATSYVTVPLAQSGAVYTGSSQASLSKCNFSSVTGTYEVRIEVTAGAWTKGVWQATALSGTARYSAPDTTVSIWSCSAASWEAALAGTLET